MKLQLSAINTVARASGCAPDDLPVDPARLRQHLAAISPAMAGLTKGSWDSVRSRILKALLRAEVDVMPSRRTKPLSHDWTLLYHSLPHDGTQKMLGRLISYCSERGIRPHDVSDRLLERFARDLKTSSLRGRPNAVVRGAIRSSNEAVDHVPGWLQHRLTRAEIKREGYVLKPEAFPPGFRKSLAEHIAFLADPPDEEDAPPAGLRPGTLALREFQFRQMASALVHRGVPVEQITSVSVLASRESVDMICDFFIERSGRPDSPQLDGFLAVLRPLALHHLKDRDVADWIRRRIRRLFGRSRRFGMTEKNRRRLAVFRDPKQIRDLLLLPYKLLKRAEPGKLPAREAAALVRPAVAIELDIMCPIRLQNLSEINIDTDFVRSRPGRNTSVHLFVPGKRTKNGEDIELELPTQSMALVDLYIAKHRNELIDPRHRGATPRFLFPRSDGTAKSGRVLADAICRVLLRELGTKFNFHLFRHLGCFLYLRSHPGQIDVMRRVLGYQDGEVTRRFYAFIEQSDAFRLFDSHVLQIRENALRPSQKSTVVSKKLKQ